MYTQIIRHTWIRTWEMITALLSCVVIALPVPDAWRIAAYVILALSLLWTVGSIAYEEHRLARKKPVPLVAFIPRPDMADEGTILDAFSAMVTAAAECIRHAGFDERKFVARYGVTQDEWALGMTEPLTEDPEEWRRVLHRLTVRVHRLQSKLRPRQVFHVFLRCPAALAMGFGASLGRLHEVVVYQHEQDAPRAPYTAVIEGCGKTDSLRAQLDRQVSSPYKTIAVYGPANEQLSTDELPCPDTPGDVVVSLFGGSHLPDSMVETLATDTRGVLLRIRPRQATPSHEEADCLLTAREVADALGALRTGSPGRRLLLAIGCRLPLAFAIGMALGTTCPITVFNYFRAEQVLCPVLQLEKLHE